MASNWKIGDVLKYTTSRIILSVFDEILATKVDNLVPGEHAVVVWDGNIPMLKILTPRGSVGWIRSVSGLEKIL